MLILNKKAIIWIIFYIFAFSFLLYNSCHSLDNDLGWHLLVGEEILEEKNVPQIDHYNYTLAGKNWVDHEWLFNLVLYSLYHNFGYIFINIFFALLIILILILANYLLQNYFNIKNIWLVMIIEFSGLIAMSPHLGVRMQELPLLNILLILFLLEKFQRTKKISILLWLIPLFALWSNLHGSFLIGQFILFFWLGIKIISQFSFFRKPLYFVDFSYPLEKKHLLQAFYIFSAAFLATLINPYGPALYGFLRDYANDFYMTKISEWRPYYYLPIQYFQLIYAALISAVLLLSSYTAIKKLTPDFEKKSGRPNLINPWYYVLTILFLVLAFKSKRNFPLFFIVSLPLVVTFLEGLLRIPPALTKIFKNNRILNFFLITTASSLTVFFLLRANLTNDPWTNRIFCTTYYPCAAVNFLKNDPAYHDLKLFNNYGWGGFILWTWPEKKLFIDGRMPQYQYGNHSLLEEYFEFWNKDKIADKLSAYGIEAVLLRRDQKIELNWIEKHFLGLDQEKINSRADELEKYLRENWQPVYQDDLSYIFVKKNSL